jgi:hypothetical protein
MPHPASNPRITYFADDYDPAKIRAMLWEISLIRRGKGFERSKPPTRYILPLLTIINHH